MVPRWMIAWAMFLAMAACEPEPLLIPPDHPISASTATIVGPYELDKLDGDVIGPCCSSQADSGRIVGGGLQLGGDAGDDKYTWRLEQVHLYDHVTRSTAFTFSAGRYTQG